jgi:hypothetical protein
MKRLCAFFLTLVAVFHTCTAKKSYVTGQVNVSGTDVIYAATLTGSAVDYYLAPSTHMLGAGGTAPKTIELPPGAAYITFHVSGPGFNLSPTWQNARPDGEGWRNGCTFLPGDNFVSGISAQSIGYLSGVFVNGNNKEQDNMMMPPALNFCENQEHFFNLEPQRNQQFLVGDGLSGPGHFVGVPQRFWLPRRATKLVLGMADSADSYADNGGQLTVNYTIVVIK